MPIPLSCEGILLWQDKLGECRFLSVELIQHNVSDVRAKVMTLLAFGWGLFY